VVLVVVRVVSECNCQQPFLNSPTSELWRPSSFSASWCIRASSAADLPWYFSGKVILFRLLEFVPVETQTVLLVCQALLYLRYPLRDAHLLALLPLLNPVP
jgi:hypothetical protein